MIRRNYSVALATIIALSSPTLMHARLYGHSFLSPRSQGTNSARHASLWHNQLYYAEYNDTFHGGWAITPAYNQSFRPKRLAEYFFGTNILGISGSMVTTRGADDILADYFGLSPSFASTVIVSPWIHNALIEGSFYGAYNAWYVQAHLPVVWASTQIDLCEQITSIANDPFPAGYMGTGIVTPPFTSFTQAMRGSAGFGDVARRTQGNILSCPQETVGLSDPQLSFGYAALHKENAFVGTHIFLGIPTGTRPRSQTLLSPIVGNGRHWELGLGLISHWRVWEKDADQTIDLSVDINATHLFNACQQRAFDFRATSTCDSSPCASGCGSGCAIGCTSTSPCAALSCCNVPAPFGAPASTCCVGCNAEPGRGFGSRYTLLKQFNENDVYLGTVVPAINLTSLWCKVKADLQIDATLMIAYQYQNLAIDFGYNAWLRTQEKICDVESCPLTGPDPYGMKGIQNAVGNATQSMATIHGNAFSTQSAVADATTTTFTNCPFNLCSAAAPYSFTHKFFSSIGYIHQTDSYQRATPLAGIGAEVEFEGIRPKNMQPDEISVSQWGVWFKVGYIW